MSLALEILEERQPGGCARSRSRESTVAARIEFFVSFLLDALLLQRGRAFILDIFCFERMDRHERRANSYIIL